LAYLPEPELEDYLHSIFLKKLTAHTISDREALIEKLHVIRERGYAINNEDLGIGIRGVAVPVFVKQNYPEYALSIVGPTFRMTDEVLDT